MNSDSENTSHFKMWNSKEEMLSAIGFTKKKPKPEQKEQQKQTTVEGGDKKDIFSLSANDHITQDSSAFTSWYCEHVLYGRAI